ncbi:keratin, type I cytoskeletal 9-like [Bicyclus anynana]|uniref:Keratin, type I cytoskeletal 9-like n=1 Tax=Bicyclus anynana TaxID=110368 RepID=A0A6J1NYB1_BICAN|nr:keratin, type I cytoskeletal 9-like [Bicyclus anynana]
MKTSLVIIFSSVALISAVNANPKPCGAGPLGLTYCGKAWEDFFDYDYNTDNTNVRGRDGNLHRGGSYNYAFGGTYGDRNRGGTFGAYGNRRSSYGENFYNDCTYGRPCNDGGRFVVDNNQDKTYSYGDNTNAINIGMSNKVNNGGINNEVGTNKGSWNGGHTSEVDNDGNNASKIQANDHVSNGSSSKHDDNLNGNIIDGDQTIEGANRGFQYRDGGGSQLISNFKKGHTYEEDRNNGNDFGGDSQGGSGSIGYSRGSDIENY